MRTPDELSERFRTSGRKVTAQRQCIFRALQGNEQHPSAEMVYETVRAEMETISLKTVYQTLNDLAELGEIAALDLGTGTVRFDPNVENGHHHLVCRSCGKVRDLFVAFDGLEVPRARARGYDVHSAEVVFRGLCDDCRRGAPPARPGRRLGGVAPAAPERP
jgi:Fe2+ or Zn2+ uptake regulation protein